MASARIMTQVLHIGPRLEEMARADHFANGHANDDPDVAVLACLFQYTMS